MQGSQLDQTYVDTDLVCWQTSRLLHLKAGVKFVAGLGSWLTFSSQLGHRSARS
jgi:hypothetical protein